MLANTYLQIFANINIIYSYRNVLLFLPEDVDKIVIHILYDKYIFNFKCIHIHYE